MLYYLILFYQSAWLYALGSSEYARLNNTDHPEDTWKTILDETQEFLEAFRNRDCWNAFLEFFDVCHSLIKHLIIHSLPVRIYTHWFPWILIYPYLLPATLKLAYRYQKYGCIRNHARPNQSHRCRFNFPQEVGVY